MEVKVMQEKRNDVAEPSAIIQGKKKNSFIEKTVVATTWVNYRPEPSKNNNPIGTLNVGQKAVVIKEKDGWYYLKDLGWSMKEFYKEQA